ncbi:hypothetical protein [Psychroserpens ponticola]|uniref:Phosphatidate cytidylyltransferase n=1 Tax=Psychroserpens ponticola TaxID=2932268 RepID=A0ABY7RV49_9FLAO|nr:hypothetical protein [Psychroserpens ponticola]WCO00987.1 hypothetical protein MUN68_013020 [Psychroserpens ponticola]
MKKLYLINKVSLIITFVLYLTIFLGMYAQMVLGALQIISALILFFFWKQLSKNSKEKLYIYWTIVTIYGLCWLMDWKGYNEYFTIVFGIMIVPMSIATYFVYILKSIKNYMI